MRALRRSFASLVVTAAAAGQVMLASPASAEPVGGCAPPFGEPLTIAELDPRAQGLGEFVDTVAPGNNDGYVCFKPAATKNQSGWLELGIIIDNRVQ